MPPVRAWPDIVGGTRRVLTGGSSKFLTQLRGLAEALPDLLAGAEPLIEASPRPVQRRLAADQVAELVAEYQAGADMRELAVRWQVHRTTVAGHLRRAGVELRRQGLSEERLSEAVRLYAEGWSLQRLAERYNCDAETVRNHIRRAEVHMRRPWERS